MPPRLRERALEGELRAPMLRARAQSRLVERLIRECRDSRERMQLRANAIAWHDHAGALARRLQDLINCP